MPRVKRSSKKMSPKRASSSSPKKQRHASRSRSRSLSRSRKPANRSPRSPSRSRSNSRTRRRTPGDSTSPADTRRGGEVSQVVKKFNELEQRMPSWMFRRSNVSPTLRRRPLMQRMLEPFQPRNLRVKATRLRRRVGSFYSRHTYLVWLSVLFVLVAIFMHRNNLTQPALRYVQHRTRYVYNYVRKRRTWF